MTQTSINNFSEGMVQDLDKSLKSKNSYQYAQNVRYLANINDNTGTLHSVESSENFTTQLLENEEIIGHRVIRDYLVLFTSKYVFDAGTIYRDDRILRFNISEDNLSNMFVVYETTDLYSNNPTNTPEYLSTAGSYEDTDNIKVYWANSTSQIRFINITTNFTGDKGKLNLIPISSSRNSITFADTIAGSLDTGMFQYAFSLLKENGGESVISPYLTALLPLYKSAEGLPSTAQIKGDLDTENTGKGIKLNISINATDTSYFNKIRLYRIHYSEYGQLPTIYIVNDYDVSSDALYDTGGSSLGTVTPEEFSILSGVNLKAYTIEDKDGYLFAANTEEDIFEIDFDARAYRFDSSKDADLYSTYGSYSTPQHSLNGGGTWEPIAEAIPVNDNVINPYNDIDNDYSSSYKYIYQSDGTTIGGEGVELSYEFTSPTGSTNVILDSGGELVEARTYNGDGKDYTNPGRVHEEKSLQRGEVYRCGIIFFNDNGTKSDVKWVGDIRIPGPYDYSSSDTFNDCVYVASSEIKARPIGIKFTLKNGLPDGATSWQMVRVLREKQDRTVLAAGMLGYTVDAATDTRPPSYPTTATDITLANSYSYNKRILTFVTPEAVLFNEDILQEGDLLTLAGHYRTPITYKTGLRKFPDFGYSGNNAYNDSIKHRALDFQTETSTVIQHPLTKVAFLNGQDFPNEPILSLSEALNSSFTFMNYSDVDDTYYGTGSDGVAFGIPGRKHILQIADDFTDSIAEECSVVAYAYIKRNNTGRYGGFTTAAKLNNSYIEFSPRVYLSYNYSTNGDTYINYFDYVNSQLTTNQTDGTPGTLTYVRNSFNSIFPVESPINLNLRGDDFNMAKIYNTDSSYLLREEAGSYENGSDRLDQLSDLYLYNSIYSQEQSIGYSFSTEDLDFRSKIDHRVYHSDKKFNDELIDSWSKFRANNFLDVESKHGAITVLKKFNNVLYFTQETAFGALSVNQRSLITDNNPGGLSLGTGDVLSRFDYIDEFYGSQHKKSVDTGNGGIYFFDLRNKSIVNFNGSQVDVLSNTKGLRSYVNNVTLKDIPFISTSSKESEVYMQLSDKVLVYNSYMGNFIGDYTFDPAYIGHSKNFTIYNNPTDSAFIYGMYLGADYGEFFISDSYQESKVRVVSNDDFYYTKTFGNVILFTNSIEGGIENNTDHFDTVSFWNDYQYTGVLGLVIGTTLERKERGYSIAIPRNIVNANGTTNIDIFNPVNQDSTRQFKERMRGKALTAEFTYENSATKGQLSVPYISFLYRPSKR